MPDVDGIPTMFIYDYLGRLIDLDGVKTTKDYGYKSIEKWREMQTAKGYIPLKINYFN